MKMNKEMKEAEAANAVQENEEENVEEDEHVLRMQQCSKTSWMDSGHGA